jgi:poly-beta-1,6-N-acetyl-D-glucosamine synthase
MKSINPLSGRETVKYVIVSPVRDESSNIKSTINSVKSQTILPVQWVIVDDGSTDGSAQILDEEAALTTWITVVHRPDRGRRSAGGGVVEAFYAGFERINCQDWEFIVKLDGDLSFSPEYFSECFRYFHEDDKLGMGGGVVCALNGGELKPEFIGDPPFHVRGATKIYRRTCWQQIAPLVQAPGWDTIDEVKANYHGWKTRTFNELKLQQHKPTGGVDGSWRNAFKNGRANYITGYHPVFMLLKCIKRIWRKPYLAQSFALALGYCTGWLYGIPKGVDEEVIGYLRRQQLLHISLQSSIYKQQGGDG